MSILIKGLKMPKDCPQCPLSHWNKIDQLTGCELVRRYVPESESSYWQSDTRPEWCPLVELPDHGELIDRDELMKHGVYMPMPGGNLPLVYMSYVKGAKAVIPAEGSEE